MLQSCRYQSNKHRVPLLPALYSVSSAKYLPETASVISVQKFRNNSNQKAFTVHDFVIVTTKITTIADRDSDNRVQIACARSYGLWRNESDPWLICSTTNKDGLLLPRGHTGEESWRQTKRMDRKTRHHERERESRAWERARSDVDTFHGWSRLPEFAGLQTVCIVWSVQQRRPL